MSAYVAPLSNTCGGKSVRAACRWFDCFDDQQWVGGRCRAVSCLHEPGRAQCLKPYPSGRRRRRR
jgi:hypothetical protein